MPVTRKRAAEIQQKVDKINTTKQLKKSAKMEQTEDARVKRKAQKNCSTSTSQQQRNLMAKADGSSRSKGFKLKN